MHWIPPSKNCILPFFSPFLHTVLHLSNFTWTAHRKPIPLPHTYSILPCIFLTFIPLNLLLQPNISYIYFKAHHFPLGPFALKLTTLITLPLHHLLVTCTCIFLPLRDDTKIYLRNAHLSLPPKILLFMPIPELSSSLQFFLWFSLPIALPVNLPASLQPFPHLHTQPTRSCHSNTCYFHSHTCFFPSFTVWLYFPNLIFFTPFLVSSQQPCLPSLKSPCSYYSKTCYFHPQTGTPFPGIPY